MNETLIPVVELRKFVEAVFLKAGVPQQDATICTDVLIASDLRGIESHGISRLKMYYDRIKTGIQFPVTRIDVIRDGPTTAVWDGNHGMGQAIGYRAMESAIEKAQTYGMGSVAVRNSTHYGIAGYYPLMAVKAGMIGLSVTNTRPSIAPTYGIKPMLGTNPIAFGAPTDMECPFLFDAATSIIQRGKVEIYARKDKTLPDGWVIDREGKFAHNPRQILQDLTEDTNALLPLGGIGEEFSGHKGYGLATIVEILSSALQTGAFLHGLTGFDSSGKKQPFKIGHFFMAIQIESFLPLDEFKKNIGGLLRELRDSPKAVGENQIYLAGEKEFENEKRIMQEGIPVSTSLQNELKMIQSELQLFDYPLPFQVHSLHD
jgi:LDH2 family malate/lactate/ureidoglycolate dehydrogenase